MKTTSFRFILAALAATAALVGCTKEITPNYENDKVNPEGSRIIAVSFAPQTKTTLDGLQPRFEDGKDTVLISNTNALDTCVVSVKDNKATISTNLTGPLTAVYPYKAAKMSEDNENEIDTVLVSTVQSGKFADANICMARMRDGKDESLSFDNKTAVFCIYPPAGKDAQHVEVSVEGFDIANCYQTGSAYTSFETIHVAPITTDSVYVSILVPEGLTVGSLSFSDGTNVKTIKDERASTAIAAGTLYTVTNANWESPEADIPDGALKGVFSVSADKQVYFSQGNLYAKNEGSPDSPDWKWHFYDEQYKYYSLSTGSSRTAADTDIEIDLFTWGYNATNSVKPIGTEYVSGHDTEGNKQLNPSTGGDDWGVAYCGSNGIDVGTWRTLSIEEWQYLFNKDNTYGANNRSGKYKYGVTVCSKANCVVLLPDNWDETVISLTDFAALNTCDENSTPKWSEMEAAGAVCLPAAGGRDGSNVNDVGDFGYYWSSTAYGSNYAYYVLFTSSYVDPDYQGGRGYGFSVRLVTDVSAAPTPTPAEPDYVEIGGKRWATKNLGAEKVATDYRCYGDYYQWGSLDKLYTSIIWTDNTTGSFVGLKEGGFAETNLTYKDNADLSDATNDVVKKTYPGTGWRMPKKEDFVALYNACGGIGASGSPTALSSATPSQGIYWLAKDQSNIPYYTGVAGLLFVDENQNMLFFPAAGYGYGTNFFDAGDYGYYWSISLSSDFTDYAYNLDFNLYGVNPQNISTRYLGYSVRPVSDK